MPSKRWRAGAGKGFCVGGDIAGMRRRMQAPAGDVAFNGWARQQRVHHAVSLLYHMPKPTIAAVNGAAAGLGADTALSCDFIVAAEEAFALGIADRLAPAGQELDAAQRWAAELARGSATALALSTSNLDQSSELSAGQVFAMGSQAQGICYTSTEHRDSVAAFLAPAWRWWAPRPTPPRCRAALAFRS